MATPCLARSLACTAAVLMGSFAPTAGAQAPAGAPVRVHDHVAFHFTAPDGTRLPAQRAAEASDNLAHVVDDAIPGEVVLVLRPEAAQFKLGNRTLFRLIPADAGQSGLAEYAPRLQATLTDFLRQERQRARLQQGVLRASLAVFFAVLCYLLLRLVLSTLRTLEKRLARDQGELPDDLRKLARGPWRGVARMALAAVRLAAWIAAALVFLLATLSLFDSTRPWRDRLASGVAEPFSAFLHRLGGALPNLLLLVLLAMVLRGGWQAITSAFGRAERSPALDGIPGERVRPYRLLARAGLLLGALLLVPFVLGGEGGVLTALGLIAAGAVGLAFVPMLASAVVGAWVLLAREYRLGEWLRVRLPGGQELTGEVTALEFTYLRLVPDSGGEVRLPHLLLLISPIVHLPEARSLSVELPVPREELAPAQALPRLLAAARWVARERGIVAAPSVQILEVTAVHARFRVGLPGAPASLRNELLLALLAAVETGAEAQPEDEARETEQ